jgi:hypothetical protein
LKEIRGKPVTSVIGASPLEAWGKALVQLGLIDEIMMKNALEAVTAAREEGLAEAKEKLETKKLQREQAKAKTQQQKQQIEKVEMGDSTNQGEADRVLEENGEAAQESLAVKPTATLGEDAALKAEAEFSRPTDQEVDLSREVVDSLPETSDQMVDAEPVTEEEERLREKIISLKGELGSRQATDAEAQQALANSRIGALGPLLHNPFGDADTSTLMSWLASLVRKEKTKMGSTGSKRKVVAVTDLLERSNTFFNGDIEALWKDYRAANFAILTFLVHCGPAVPLRSIKLGCMRPRSDKNETATGSESRQAQPEGRLLKVEKKN